MGKGIRDAGIALSKALPEVGVKVGVINRQIFMATSLAVFMVFAGEYLFSIARNVE